MEFINQDQTISVVLYSGPNELTCQVIDMISNISYRGLFTLDSPEISFFEKLKGGMTTLTRTLVNQLSEWQQSTDYRNIKILLNDKKAQIHLKLDVLGEIQELQLTLPQERINSEQLQSQSQIIQLKKQVEKLEKTIDRNSLNDDLFAKLSEKFVVIGNQLINRDTCKSLFLVDKGKYHFNTTTQNGYSSVKMIPNSYKVSICLNPNQIDVCFSEIQPNDPDIISNLKLLNNLDDLTIVSSQLDNLDFPDISLTQLSIYGVEKVSNRIDFSKLNILNLLQLVESPAFKNIEPEINYRINLVLGTNDISKNKFPNLGILEYRCLKCSGNLYWSYRPKEQRPNAGQPCSHMNI